MLLRQETQLAPFKVQVVPYLYYYKSTPRLGYQLLVEASVYIIRTSQDVTERELIGIRPDEASSGCLQRGLVPSHYDAALLPDLRDNKYMTLGHVIEQ